MQHLLIIEDDEGKRTLYLNEATSSIGRDLSNSIVLHSHAVSRQHAILLRVTQPGETGHLFRIIDGNLQGQPSTNGLFVNGKRCHSHDLCSGDVIIFGGQVQVRYCTETTESEVLPAALDYLGTITLAEDDEPSTASESLQTRHDAALIRLASFPELFAHPVLELSDTGELIYLNPAAISQFPQLQTATLRHPLLAGIIDSVKATDDQYFTREVTIEGQIFEQAVHHIPESDLIRSYLVNITERKQTEDALRIAEEQYRSIFENALEGIFQSSLGGRYITVNAKMAQIYGYDSPEEMIAGVTNISSQIYVDPEGRNHFQRRLEQLGEVKALEYQAYRKDDCIIWIQEHARAVRDSSGNVLYFEGIVQDITERKRIEAELKEIQEQLEQQVQVRTAELTAVNERLRREEQALLSSYATNRALLNAIPDPMFRISRTGRFVNFKTPKSYTLPLKPEDCLNRSLSEVFPAAVAAALQRCIEAALTTEEIQIVEFPLAAAGQRLDFEARIAVSATDEVLAIVRDITERKRGEIEIRNALERERELNELKTRFVSMTSHEFRTPLTTILSSAELLEHYSGQWDEQKRHQYLRKIQTSAQHMTELLNDILLINKAEAGKLEFNPQPLNLVQHCREIIEELQITTQKHTLQLRSQSASIHAMLDRKLIRHMLTNLLSNAINYSPGGGNIRIDLAQKAHLILIRVTDQGIGIPAEMQSTLFDSFVRGSNVGNISGTGLGLAIVKKSVDRHQGQISVKSQVGCGTSFSITLPLQPVLPEGSAQELSQPV
jgi:PAS domain S-box-containing protein